MENCSTHLSTWISADVKQRFAAVAACQGLSESALLRRLVQRSLTVTGELTVGQQPSLPARDARLTVRLVPDDSLLLRERAASRGMPAASYVSALVRSHLRCLAPLPDKELAALRSAVAQLAAMGRTLNVLARATLSAGASAGPGREHVTLLLKICQGVHAHVQGLIKANITSWESGHAQGSH